MFNNTFYPSSPEVIDQLIEGLELRGKKAFDPQGGSGKIVERLVQEGAEVIACEIDQDLKKILQTKCVIIGNDFMKVTSEQISHIDCIVMNPPFNNADQHILHAWTIAPAGCKIRSLCNLQTIKNPYSKSREELKTLVDTYGSSMDLGEAFAKAERRTSVEVGLIRLEKPGANYNSEFEGFYMDEDPEEAQVNGLMNYNMVRDLVNRYVGAVKIFDEQLKTAIQLNSLTTGFYGKKLGFQVTQEGAPMERNQFKKDMQKSGWKWILSKLNMEKHATKGLREDINKFVEAQYAIPFTMKNIYRMLEIIIATTSQRFDKAILDVFERITIHHDENRMGVPGWKTNSHFLLTRRFIMPGVITRGYSGPEVTHYSERYELVDDLVKSLCYISGENYDKIGSIWSGIRNGKVITKDLQWSDKEGKDVEVEVKTDIDYGKWFEWAMFKIRVYKKGTVHFEFKDDKVWANFNKRVAKLKGYPLPENKSETAYQARQNGHKASAPKAKTVKHQPVVLSTINISG